MDTIRFTINGRQHAISGLPPETTLLRYLRDQAQLTGTKEGCAEGDCGACSVALLETDATGKTGWRAVNSCLVLIPALHGRRLVTVEGLADGDRLHPAQRALVDHMGSQCGFCTPGFVMALFEGCYREDLDDQGKRDDQICGNLCRCTGYRPIRDALDDVAGSKPSGAFCDALKTPCPPQQALDYTDSERRFIRPTTLSALWDALRDNPSHRFIGGSTDLGLEVTKRDARFPCLIAIDAIPQMRTITAQDDTITVGAAVTLSTLEDHCDSHLPPVARMLRYFASRQIKNRATLGGNLCNASPIGDMAPVMLALEATAIIASASGQRRVPFSAFFERYRQTALKPGEILFAVEIPVPQPNEHVGVYKVSKRRELDISAVCAAMKVRLDPDGRVESASIAYGGMAATPSRAAATERAITGQRWSEDAARRASAHIRQDFTPISDHRGSDWYRATVAENLLIGFALETATGPAPIRMPARSTGTILPGGA